MKVRECAGVRVCNEKLFGYNCKFERRTDILKKLKTLLDGGGGAGLVRLSFDMQQHLQRRMSNESFLNETKNKLLSTRVGN